MRRIYWILGIVALALVGAYLFAFKPKAEAKDAAAAAKTGTGSNEAAGIISAIGSAFASLATGIVAIVGATGSGEEGATEGQANVVHTSQGSKLED